LEKSYSDPERDYFVYGSLVDCLLTTPAELDKRFALVARRVSDKGTLVIEEKIKELNTQLQLSPNDAKVAKALKKECEKLAIIAQRGEVTQVPPAMWHDAHETARAIERNPFFQELKAAGERARWQEVIATDNPKRKGQVDCLYFSCDAAASFWQLYASGRMEAEELKNKMQQIDGVTISIIDIKTTARLTEFDPRVYDGQLAFYRQMVYDLTGIKAECYIIAGDKADRKMAQDYWRSGQALDFKFSQIVQLEEALAFCHTENTWPPAKELRGKDQECFRCSACRERPFSSNNSPLFIE